MNNLLEKFKSFNATKNDLMEHYGNDLVNAKCETCVIVKTGDVITAIQKYQDGEITLLMLLDWVNTLWFSDYLFTYDESQRESIASVMDKLEELDEEGVFYTDEDYERMIYALKNNISYTR